MDMTDPDFVQILEKLQTLGYYQKDIAKEIGVTQGAISQFVTGKTKTLRFQSGVKLIELYQRVVKNTNS
ncbi:MAG: helix-turn-helix domain-containing protein [Neisseriaceae bacterium]|nr:helix-turn-helix domain-containing protein [Neisseriaceae bacterium]